MRRARATPKGSEFIATVLTCGLLTFACGGGVDGRGSSHEDCPQGDESCEDGDPCEAAYEACLDEAGEVLSNCWDGIQAGTHDNCTSAGAHLSCTLRFDEAADVCRGSYEDCAPLPDEEHAGYQAFLAERNCKNECSETAYNCFYDAHDAGCTPSGLTDCEAPLEDCWDACDAVNDSCGDGIVQSGEACDAGETGDPGCEDCGVVFSYLCSGAPSVCNRTGLREDLVLSTASDDEAFTFCEWFIGILGGEGAQRTCGVDPVVYTTRSVNSCAGSIRNSTGGCTVGELETWAGEKSGPCGLSLSSDPACVNNDPNVSIVQSGEEEDLTPTPNYTEETAAQCLWWNEQADDCSLCMATAACDALGTCNVGLDGDCVGCWEAGDPSSCREISNIATLRRWALAYCDAECHDEKNLCNISDSEDSCTACLEESCCEEFADCADSTCLHCWEDGDCFSFDTGFEEMQTCAAAHCDGCVPDPLL